MHYLDLKPAAADFLGTLPSKQYRQVAAKMFQLLKNPTPHDAQRMKEFPFYRTDIGEYRIIYQFTQTILTIVLIGKRNDDEVYKFLKRKF